MPPKPKLYNSLGKSQIKNNFKNSPQNNLSMTPEQEQQFQVELYWCINQLQTALNCGKLNNKQGRCEHFLYLHIHYFSLNDCLLLKCAKFYCGH